MQVASSNTNESVQATYAPGLQAFVFVLFFAFGGITSLNDVLIPKLRGLFTLSYGEVMLIQFAFFAAYFIVSIGSGVICMAIVGGAIVPLVTGNAADLWGLKYALAVPAACYCGILLFGWFARRPLRASA